MKRISLKGLLGLWMAITLLTLPLLVFGCGTEEKATPSSDEMETTVARAVIATQTADAESILGSPKTETAIAKTIFATQTAKAEAENKSTPEPVSPTATINEKAARSAEVDKLKRTWATQTAQAGAGRSATEAPVPTVPGVELPYPTATPITGTVIEPPYPHTVVPPIPTDTPIPPTSTPMPTATNTPIPTVDVATCWSYNPDGVEGTVRRRDGITNYYLEFSAPFDLLLDTYEDIVDALALFRRHTEYCRIGHGNSRPNPEYYIVEYFTGNASTDRTIENRDCIPYDPATLQIVDIGAEGWRLLYSGTGYMAILDNEADARAALAVASQHTQHCFIGRGNTRPNKLEYIHEYWE